MPNKLAVVGWITSLLITTKGIWVMVAWLFPEDRMFYTEIQGRLDELIHELNKWTSDQNVIRINCRTPETIFFSDATL